MERVNTSWMVDGLTINDLLIPNSSKPLYIVNGDPPRTRTISTVSRIYPKRWIFGCIFDWGPNISEKTEKTWI